MRNDQNKNQLKLRVSSGTAKNKGLKVPNIEGFRAIQEVMKQSVFSIIGENIEDSECLDLYAGSGNMGIEALSRGAGHCTFVDENYEAIRAIKENIQNCGFEEKSTVIRSDSTKFAANTDQKFDLIFVDPYYTDTAHAFLLKNLGEILNDDGTVFFFHGENLELGRITNEAGLKIVDERKFGKSIFSTIKK